MQTQQIWRLQKKKKKPFFKWRVLTKRQNKCLQVYKSPTGENQLMAPTAETSSAASGAAGKRQRERRRVLSQREQERRQTLM